MAAKDELLIGKITSTHGLHGALKIYPYTDSLDLFVPGSVLSVHTTGGTIRPYTLTSAKPHRKSMVLVQLKDVASIEAAESLIGLEISVDRSLLPETDEDEFYWDELIGLSVQTVSGEFLGRLNHIFRTGSNDVYVINGQNGELLIPALKSVVQAVSLADGVMTVELPDGLLE